MEVNEAKKVVEKANPGLKAAYAVPFNDKIVFQMVKENGGVVFTNVVYAVDQNTGKAEKLRPFEYDFTGFDEARRKEAVYFTEQGMVMARMETI